MDFTMGNKKSKPPRPSPEQSKKKKITQLAEYIKSDKCKNIVLMVCTVLCLKKALRPYYRRESADKIKSIGVFLMMSFFVAGCW